MLAMFTMKRQLLALVMTILTQTSHGDRPLSPLWSCATRYRCTSFIHRCHDPINPSLCANKNKKLSTSHHNRIQMPSKMTTHQPARLAATHLAMSSSPVPSSSQRTSPSPWSPGSWKMTLEFGLEESSSSSSLERNENSQLLSDILGEEWGSNGGRLGLSFQIFASAETTTKTSTQKEDGNSVQMTWLGGKPTGTIECIHDSTNDGEDYCASYINEKGQQNVQISSGQWRIEPPLPLLPSYAKILPGQASTLRFYMTLDTPIQRNTITFTKDQLLILQSNTFRTKQYSSGVQTLLPYQYEKDRTQKLLEEQLNHETGDRRLDGNDIFETLGGYKDVAKLSLERDAKRRKWSDVEGSLPKLDSSINTGRRVDIHKLLEDEKRWGIWPGDTELMTSERGVILAVVAKESKPGLFRWMSDNGMEEPVVVGKWSILPILEEQENLMKEQ